MLRQSSAVVLFEIATQASMVKAPVGLRSELAVLTSTKPVLVGYPGDKASQDPNGCACAAGDKIAARTRPGSRNPKRRRSLDTRRSARSAPTLMSILLPVVADGILLYLLIYSTSSTRVNRRPRCLVCWAQGEDRALRPSRHGGRSAAIDRQVGLQRFEGKTVGGGVHHPHAAAPQMAGEAPVGEQDLQARHLGEGLRRGLRRRGGEPPQLGILEIQQQRPVPPAEAQQRLAQQLGSGEIDD